MSWIKGVGSELGSWQGKGQTNGKKDKSTESAHRLAGSSVLGLSQAAVFI